MVALCQNGWPVIETAAGVGRYTITGTKYVVTARPGDSSVILLDWLGFLHAEVEPLVVPGVWGWAVRLVRGSTTDASNHSGGDAVDASAPLHPLGTDPAANWKPNPQRIDRMHRRLAALRQVTAGRTVLRWGGDYTGRKDGMHAELIAGAADRKLLADAIRSGRLPGGEVSYLAGTAAGFRAGTTPTPTPAPTPTPEDDDDMTRIIRLNDGSGRCLVVDYGQHTVWHIPNGTEYTHLTDPPSKGGAGIPVLPQNMAPELYGSYRDISPAT